jgi:16S rRNA (adenine1518-N6/adenine1519-N6)-dimethyltransferase
LFTVSAGAFQPRPKVDSAVLRLTPLAEPLVSDARRAVFRRLVVGLFGFRRKQLQRGIRELTGWEPDRALAALTAAGLDPAVRPETVAPQGFVALLGTLVDGGWPAE